MRTLLRPDVLDELLLDTLLATEVAFVTSGSNARCFEGQLALVTAVSLIARSGAQCYLEAPNTELSGVTSPLTSGRLMDGLLGLGQDLIPGRSIDACAPSHEVDLAVVIGDSSWRGKARQVIRLSGNAWFGRIAPNGERWRSCGSPFGALTSAGLAAGEAYKAAMRRVRDWAAGPTTFDALFAAAPVAEIALAPPGAPPPSCDLGEFDFISGGAITQAALYALSRIPRARGRARVIEPETNDLSNLNRYAFLRRSRLKEEKATHVASLDLDGLKVAGVPLRYCERNLDQIGSLAPRVLVGVDHIPSRWAVQRARPSWLGIGATTDYFVLVTFHQAGLACARCLHQDGTAMPTEIPTAAFVSHWAGLWLASLFARTAAGEQLPHLQQQTMMATLRPESRSAVMQSRGDPRIPCDIGCPL
jgi:hypothetical protein